MRETLVAAILLGQAHNFLDAADLAGNQSDFDAMRMAGRVGENVAHHALRQLTAALVLLLDNFYPQAGFDVGTRCAVHVSFE